MISRRKSQIWRWVSTLLVLLIVLPVAGSILAQSDDAIQTDDSMLPGEVEIVGVLESFDGTTITVGGIPFDVTGAEIKDDLIIGQLVKIHASFANGVWTAREAELDDDTGDDDNGNDNVDDGNVNDNVGDNGNVNDNVDDNGNDNSDDDNDNSDDDNGNDNADDNSNDNSSGDDAPDGEFELTGVLEQVGDGFIVVAGQVIDITGAEIKNQLVVGSMVKVHLSLVNGQLVARETEDALGSEDDGDDDSSHQCGDVPEGWTTYVVQGGDTLSGIAVRSDSDDDDLADVNCIENPGQIVVGAEILVPREPDPQSVLIDDNGNDNSDDNGNDNSDDDNGNDNSDDDNGNDNSDDDNGNDNGDDDSGGDHGDDDSGDDHGDDDDGGDDSDDD